MPSPVVFYQCCIKTGLMWCDNVSLAECTSQIRGRQQGAAGEEGGGQEWMPCQNMWQALGFIEVTFNHVCVVVLKGQGLYLALPDKGPGNISRGPLIKG